MTTYCHDCGTELPDAFASSVGWDGGSILLSSQVSSQVGKGNARARPGLWRRDDAD